MQAWQFYNVNQRLIADGSIPRKVRVILEELGPSNEDIQVTAAAALLACLSQDPDSSSGLIHPILSAHKLLPVAAATLTSHNKDSLLARSAANILASAVFHSTSVAIDSEDWESLLNGLYAAFARFPDDRRVVHLAVNAVVRTAALQPQQSVYMQHSGIPHSPARDYSHT
jgi:hypothetical protein